MDSEGAHLSHLSPCRRRVYPQTCMPHTHTWSKPGFSSGAQLIAALWLHSSQEQPGDPAQLRSAIGAAAAVGASSLPTTQHNVYLLVGWVLVFFPVTHNPLQEGLFYFTVKKLLKAIFIRY